MSVSIFILLLTSLVSYLAFKNSSLFYKLDFSPVIMENQSQWYRFISHALIHADWIHLGLNMFVLWMFGAYTEAYFEAYLGAKGSFYFILLYVGGIGFAVLPSYKKHRNNPAYHSVGASGAISAVVFSSIIFEPGMDLCLYGLPFLCFPGIIWGLVYLIYSYQKAKKSDDRINHDAHLWGALFGICFTLISIPESFPAFLQQILLLIPSL